MNSAWPICRLVRPSANQRQHLGLALREAKGGGRRRRRLRFRRRVDRFFEAQAAALGKQLDFTL
jgi:hypothetical protein